MKKTFPLVVVAVLLVVFALWWRMGTQPHTPSTTFEECVAAGNPVMESYPRRCRDGENTFVENIGNELEKANLIRITTPRPNQIIGSPLTIEGEARGGWFFEASFPVFLTDWDGRIIAQGIATAKGDWMTADFVPFEAVLTFTVDPNVYSNRGSLILKKDNPSGLPKNDDALEIPVVFAAATGALAIGTNATIHGTTIGILELMEDSRCPSDVQCVWAGTVRVRVSLDSYNRDFTFTLGQPQVVGKATITLTAVTPAEKFSTQTVPLSDYRFTFTVEEESLQTLQ